MLAAIQKQTQKSEMNSVNDKYSPILDRNRYDVVCTINSALNTKTAVSQHAIQFNHWNGLTVPNHLV